MDTVDFEDNNKIERPDLLPRVKNFKQSDWIKACKKLGIWIAPGGGKGSHVCGYRIENGERTISNLVITLQQNNLHPHIQYDYVKKLITYGRESGAYTENDVWRVLKILK